MAGFAVFFLFVAGLSIVGLAVPETEVGNFEEFVFVAEVHSGHPPHFFIHSHFFVQVLVFA